MKIAHWDTVRIEDQSRISDIDLLYAQFQNEEYLHAEVELSEEPYLQALWSTSLPLPEVIAAIHRHIGPAISHEAYHSQVSFSDLTDLETNPVEAEQHALARHDKVALYTGAYSLGGLITWRTPVVKMSGGIVSHSEINYGERSPQFEVFLNLIIATATAHVVEALQTDSSPLEKKFRLLK